MQYTDFDALQTPSPDRQALLDVIREALDAALEQDHSQIQVVLSYAQVGPNGVMDRPTVSRQLSLPTDGTDPAQAADAILDSYLNRAPGEGFVGQIRVEFLAEDDGETYALGVYERRVRIGNANHQLPGPDVAGYLPPPYPGASPAYGGMGDPYGGMGGPRRPYGPMPPEPMDHRGFGHGPVPQMDELTEEQHGMLLAQNAANERRLDLVFRQNQHLVDHLLQTNQHFIQFASYYMNQYQSPQMPSGGGAESPIAAIIGGLLSMWMGGQGGGQEAPPPPQPPATPPFESLPPMEDAFQPPPMGGMEVAPEDITEDAANAWAQQNPDAAKRVARNLLPTQFQGLIPK